MDCITLEVKIISKGSKALQYQQVYKHKYVRLQGLMYIHTWRSYVHT